MDTASFITGSRATCRFHLLFGVCGSVFDISCKRSRTYYNTSTVLLRLKRKSPRVGVEGLPPGLGSVNRDSEFAGTQSLLEAFCRFGRRGESDVRLYGKLDTEKTR